LLKDKIKALDYAGVSIDCKEIGTSSNTLLWMADELRLIECNEAKHIHNVFVRGALRCARVRCIRNDACFVLAYRHINTPLLKCVTETLLRASQPTNIYKVRALHNALLGMSIEFRCVVRDKAHCVDDEFVRAVCADRNACLILTYWEE
jgi:hypothetical protein